MAEPARNYPRTREEFLAWEDPMGQRYEFWGGETFARTGGRQVHVIASGNCYSLLRSHLRGGPCRAYMADMGIEIEAADAVVYPDVFVSCHPDDLAAERMLHHPRVVIEVLSESTAAYDRGAKFAAYRGLPSLLEYVLIDPDRRSVEIFRRTDSGDWLFATHDGERGLILPSLDFEATLADVFEDLPAIEAGP